MRGVQELDDVVPGGWKRNCKDDTGGGEAGPGSVFSSISSSILKLSNVSM